MSDITESAIHKEIDLIQSCIVRMANNSFLVKGWAVTLVAVILAFIPEDVSIFLTTGILMMVILCFWYLDSFFLHTENMYRKLYEWVIGERSKKNPYKMYDLNPHRFKSEAGSLFSVMISKILCIFYGIPMVSIIVFLVVYIFQLHL